MAAAELLAHEIGFVFSVAFCVIVAVNLYVVRGYSSVWVFEIGFVSHFHCCSLALRWTGTVPH